MIQIWAAWSFSVDDAYITMRYAKHWFNGDGLVWNIGEPPLEGYSNFTAVGLAYFAEALQLNPLNFLKCTGVLALLALTYGEYALTRLWCPARIAWIPCIWLLAYRGQILWSVSGLETSLYEALLLFSTFFLLRKDMRLAGLGFALASLTRPEAPLLFVVYVGLLIHATRQHQESWVNIRRFITAFLVVVIPYYLWKWVYFGDLLPNPVHCKAFSQPLNGVLDFAYLRLLLPFLVCAIFSFRAMKGPNSLWLWVPTVVYLLMCWGADPIVAFENRLFLPAFALFLPLALIGLQHAVKRYGVLCLLAMTLLFFEPTFTFVEYQQYTKNPEAGRVLRHHVSNWLLKNTKFGDAVVLADSGLIPYHVERQFIDSTCLNNREMAREGYARYCRSVLSKQPEFIILTALVQHGVVESTRLDACLYQALQHSVTYTGPHIIQTDNQPNVFYRYSIYQRI